MLQEARNRVEQWGNCTVVRTSGERRSHPSHTLSGCPEGQARDNLWHPRGQPRDPIGTCFAQAFGSFAAVGVLVQMLVLHNKHSKLATSLEHYPRARGGTQGHQRTHHGVNILCALQDRDDRRNGKD